MIPISVFTNAFSLSSNFSISLLLSAPHGLLLSGNLKSSMTFPTAKFRLDKRLLRNRAMNVAVLLAWRMINNSKVCQHCAQLYGQSLTTRRNINASHSYDFELSHLPKHSALVNWHEESDCCI